MSKYDDLMSKMSVDELEQFKQGHREELEAERREPVVSPITIEALKSAAGAQAPTPAQAQVPSVEKPVGAATRADGSAADRLKTLTDPVKYREGLYAVMKQNTEARAAGIGMLYLMNANKQYARAVDVMPLIASETNPKVSNVAGKLRVALKDYPSMSAERLLKDVQGVDPQIVFGKMAEEPKNVFESADSMKESAGRIVRDFNTKPEYAKFREARANFAPASEQVKTVGLKPETLTALQKMSFPVAFGEMKKCILPQDAKLAELNIYHESRDQSPASQMLVMQTTFNRALGLLEKDKTGNNVLRPGSLTETILDPYQFSWANNVNSSFWVALNCCY